MMNANVPFTAVERDGGNAQHGFQWRNDLRKSCENTEQYIATVKKRIDDGHLTLNLNPIIKTTHPLVEMAMFEYSGYFSKSTLPTAGEIAIASSLPTVYAWVPA